MWAFEHAPLQTELASRYDIHYTAPSRCASELHEGRAGLGLIPIAALAPGLAIVPGCTIASLDRVRSIQLIVKQGAFAKRRVFEPALEAGADPAQHVVDEALQAVRSVAADAASRSSLAYVQVLFRRFLKTDPVFTPAAADPVAMLQSADAALLIGDPALLALEARAEIERQPGVGPCLWIDIAHQWRLRTGLPWVAAVWAVRPGALREAGLPSAQVIADLNHSRDTGLAHIPDLVNEWSPRIPLPPTTVREYLTENIHYTLTPECVAAIELLRKYASETDVLPRLAELRFL